MAQTRFQQIYANENPKREFLYDDGEFFAMLDAFPVNPGHALIIPVEPIVSLFDLSEAQMIGLYRALEQTKLAILNYDLAQEYKKIIALNISPRSVELCQQALIALQASGSIDGYNIGVNDGRAAGRTIDHLHVHLIPRYIGDMDKPEGGVRHIMPGKGYYR